MADAPDSSVLSYIAAGAAALAGIAAWLFGKHAKEPSSAVVDVQLRQDLTAELKEQEKALQAVVSAAKLSVYTRLEQIAAEMKDEYRTELQRLDERLRVVENMTARLDERIKMSRE